MNMQLVPAYQHVPSVIYTLALAPGWLVRYETPTGNKVERPVPIAKDPNLERELVVSEGVQDDVSVA